MTEAFVWPELKSAAGNAAGASREARLRAVEEGRAAGFQQGLEEGRRAAEAEVDALRSQLQAALQQVEATLGELTGQQSDALAGLVHALCHKVLGCELTTNPAVLEHVLAEGLSRLEADCRGAELYVNPDDHAALLAGYQGDLVLHADPDVPRCGLSVRLSTQAADFQPAALIDELFDEVRDDLTG